MLEGLLKLINDVNLILSCEYDKENTLLCIVTIHGLLSTIKNNIYEFVNENTYEIIENIKLMKKLLEKIKVMLEKNNETDINVYSAIQYIFNIINFIFEHGREYKIIK